MPANRKKLGKLYAAERAALRKALRRVRQLLNEVVGNLEDKNLVRARLAVLRIKTLESLHRKAEDKGWSSKEAISYAGDLIGARVVCSNLDDVARFAELLREALQSIADEPIEIQNYIRSPQPSGYRAIHFNFRLDVGEFLNPKLFGCEIQIRTVLQDGWGDLTHEDVYKHGEDLPQDLKERAKDLAELLTTADGIAQSIRNRVGALRPAPKAKPGLDSVTEDGLVSLFASVFGRSPKDYTVREAMDKCHEAGLVTLQEVDTKLRDEILRDKLRTAHATETDWQLEMDKLLVLSIVAATKGDKRAIRAARDLGRRAWLEVDTQSKQQVLGGLPEKIDDLMYALKSHDLNIESVAEALGATNECAVCGTTTVDVDTFEDAIADHYDIHNLDGKVVGILLSSGVETGMACDSSLCAYHANLFDKDD